MIKNKISTFKNKKFVLLLIYCQGDVAESAEGGTLLRCYMGQPVSWVRIPPSPNFKTRFYGGFFVV